MDSKTFKWVRIVKEPLLQTISFLSMLITNKTCNKIKSKFLNKLFFVPLSTYHLGIILIFQTIKSFHGILKLNIYTVDHKILENEYI